MTVAGWRKSPGCASNECAEVGNYRTSSRSGYNGNCLEAGSGDRGVAVRDTKDRGGPVLTFGAGQWQAFLSSLRPD